MKLIKTCYFKIPNDTDIIISHNPALSYCDNGHGCPSLLKVIK